MDNNIDRLAVLLHEELCDRRSAHDATLGRCYQIAARLAAAGVTVAPKPDSPAADDGVACDWDENGYCRCKPAPALDVERLARAISMAENHTVMMPEGYSPNALSRAAAIARAYGSAPAETCGDRSWDSRYACTLPAGHTLTGPDLTSHHYAYGSAPAEEEGR